jgi:hypothetical protein
MFFFICYGGVDVVRDGGIVKYLFIECRKCGCRHVCVWGGGGLEHAPELLGLMFKHFWELKLESRSGLFAALSETGVCLLRKFMLSPVLLFCFLVCVACLLAFF